MHSTTSLPAFDSQSRTRLIFGEQTLQQVGEIARELGGRRALLVTDKGLVEAGHPARAAEFLSAAGLHVAIADGVSENPTTLDVERCVEIARADQSDILIGLGGGSSLDAAKGCNFLLTNGQQMQDYWGFGKATKPMLPLIAVPTTAGTGSECQSYALISDVATHRKMACGDLKAAPNVAILDPLLTVSQPRAVTAFTGIDAIAHAVESAVTSKRSPLSWIYSRESFRLCIGALERVLDDPCDLEARGMMQLGAAFAGIAIENSMLGAAHAAANPLTARCGIVHGQAVGLMLPAVIEFNTQIPEARERYDELAATAGLGALEELIEQLVKLIDIAGVRAGLGKFGVTHDAIPELAKEAAQQWTVTFNPRPADKDDFARLYKASLDM